MRLEDVSVMHIIKLVFMQDSLCLDLTQRLSLVNGNTKLVLALESKLEIKYGLLDT